MSKTEQGARDPRARPLFLPLGAPRRGTVAAWTRRRERAMVNG